MPAVPELESVDYEHDPLHRNDPLKDKNADKVLTALGMTEEEKNQLKHEKRDKTSVDTAVESCYAETKEHGCTDHDSPFRCLATAVTQKAAEISEHCRKATEKALPYACSVELFITHCDGLSQPLIPCLDSHHPKLGPECLDVLTVTKKVLSTLKKKPKPDTPVRQNDSSGSGTTYGFVAVAIALAVYFYQGGSMTDLGYKSQTLMRMIQRATAGLSGHWEPPAQKSARSQSDWTDGIDDGKDDDRKVSLNNFGGYGGLS